jgi:hypothetical protein
VSVGETFTRLYYYGIVQLGLSDEKFWTMPFGTFMDLWACHTQFLGLDTPKRELSLDDVIVDGI